MHITILTVGSRGDIQPYLALGDGLRKNGHSIRMATHAIYRDWVTSLGMEFAPVEGDPRGIVQGELGQDWLSTGRNPFGFVSGFRDLMGEVMRTAFADAWQACQDTGAILVSGLGFYAGQSIAERLGIPMIQAYLQPVHPNHEFASPLFPTPLPDNVLYNMLTHIIGGQMFWQVLRPGVNRAREELLDLPPQSWMGPFLEIERRKLPVYYGFSPAVIPRPNTWGDHIHITGYWFLDEPDWTAPEELLDFLEDGPAPVYVGFGSMADREPEKTAEIVLDALKQCGQRGLLLTGWGGLSQSDLPDTCYKIEAAPHDWLFPRMAAVVHHAGAGTTAAGLRAGVANICVPFFGDQFFWARRVEKIGAGPAPIRRDQLTVPRLTEAIRQALANDTRCSAARAGEQIRSEGGVQCAARLIGGYLKSAMVK